MMKRIHEGKVILVIVVRMKRSEIQGSLVC
jgi:hypothetical protein